MGTIDTQETRIPVSARQFEAITQQLVHREAAQSELDRLIIETGLSGYVAAIIAGSDTPEARGHLVRLESPAEWSPGTIVLGDAQPARIECKVDR